MVSPTDRVAEAAAAAVVRDIYFGEGALCSAIHVGILGPRVRPPARELASSSLFDLSRQRMSCGWLTGS